MKKILALFITFLIVLVMAGCETEPLPVKEDVCLDVEDVTFYASTTDGLLGTTDIIMLETAFGDVEIKEDVYERAVLGVYSKVCISTEDGVATKFKTARLVDLAVPDPPTVEVIVEVPVIEYVEVEVEVPVEVQTHAEIDPDLWISVNHPVYFYYVQEDVIHLVYTEDTTSYTLTILFDPSFAFSDKVMVAGIVYEEVGIYQGYTLIQSEFVETEFEDIEAFVQDYIVTYTIVEIAQMYEGTYVEPGVE